jgi:hypothetical protein
VLIASPNLLEGQKLDGSMDKEGAVFVNVWNHNGELQFVHWACEHKGDLSRCPCKTGVSGQILCLHKWYVVTLRTMNINLGRCHHEQTKVREILDQPNMWHVKDMTPNPNQIKLPQCH